MAEGKASWDVGDLVSNRRFTYSRGLGPIWFIVARVEVEEGVTYIQGYIPEGVRKVDHVAHHIVSRFTTDSPWAEGCHNWGQ